MSINRILLQVLAQHTKLDKEIDVQKERKLDNGKLSDPTKQMILPLDPELKYDLNEDLRYKKIEKKPLEPIDLNYPNLTPEQIKYRQLNEKEKDRLRGSDEEEYRYNNRYRYPYNEPKEFVPSNQKYYELDKAPAEEAKNKLLEKYKEFQTVAAEFQEKYQQANEMAADTPVMNYGETYIELFKNFPKYVLAEVRKEIGAIFGFGNIKSTRTQDLQNLAEILNRGLNLFNITPLNLEHKIEQLDKAILYMNSTIKEFNKKVKILKYLEPLDAAVKKFLLKREQRAFLKWMDQYFPNDKQDFMKNILSDFKQNHSNGFNLGSISSVKTYSDMYYSAWQTSTHSLFNNIETKTIEEIKTRLKEQVDNKIKLKEEDFNQAVAMSNVENNFDPLVRYCYKSFQFDLRPIFSFVFSSMERNSEKSEEYKILSPENKKNELLSDKKLYFQYFFEDLQKTHKYSKNSYNYGDNTTDSLIRKYMRKYLNNEDRTKSRINIDALSEESGKVIDELVNKYYREIIIGSLPNFNSTGYGQQRYTFPNFSGMGTLLKETGKLSADAIANSAHASIPFIPKEYLLHLAKSLIKGNVKENASKSLENLAYMSGTNYQLAMQVLFDILKRTGKTNPDVFTNVFTKSFGDIQYIVTRMSDDLKAFSNEEKVNIISNVFRNTDTIERDKENAEELISFLHNSARNLDKKDILQIIQNKNFQNYSKIGIVKKLFDAFASIKNMKGLKGIYDQYGTLIKDMQDNGFISKNFDKNIRLILKSFNSNEPISPASPIFKQLFDATSTIETDLQSIAISEDLATLSKDYQKKDERLFKLDYKINDNLRFRVLKDKDPRTLRIGIESNCCQRIGGVGEEAAKDSFINPLAGVLILEWLNDGEWKMLTQSYFHYVPKTNSYILDNVEYNRENVTDSGVDLASAYALLAQNAKEKFDVGNFLAGKSYSKIPANKFKTEKLKGGDPRFFAVPKPYSDFSPSDSINLLSPKFKPVDLSGMKEELKHAFEVMLPKLIRYSSMLH